MSFSSFSFFINDFFLSQISKLLFLAWALPLHLYKLFLLHNPKEFHLLILVIGLCLWAFYDKVKITDFLLLRSCRGCDLKWASELCCWCCSTAREDLWVHIFLVRLIMVDDLVRSVIVKILHSVDGRDVEQWLEPRNKSSCLWLLTLSLFTLLSLYLLAILYYLLICMYYLCCDWYLLSC